MQDAHQIPSARIWDNRNARRYYPAPFMGRLKLPTTIGLGHRPSSAIGEPLCETAGGQATSTTVCLAAHDDIASSEDRQQLAISPDVATGLGANRRQSGIACSLMPVAQASRSPCPPAPRTLPAQNERAWPGTKCS